MFVCVENSNFTLAILSLLIQRPQKTKDKKKKVDGEIIEKQGEMDDGCRDGWRDG